MLNQATVVFSHATITKRAKVTSLWHLRRQVRRASTRPLSLFETRIGKALDGIRHNQVSFSYPVVVFHDADYCSHRLSILVVQAAFTCPLTSSQRNHSLTAQRLNSHFMVSQTSSLPERAEAPNFLAYTV